MRAISDLLDRAKTARSITSDKSLAERIGRSRALISEWRKGEKLAQDNDIAQLAELAREPVDAWLIRVRADQATGASKKHWQQLALRVGIAATIALVVAGNPLFSSVSQGAEFLTCLLCQV